MLSRWLARARLRLDRHYWRHYWQAAERAYPAMEHRSSDVDAYMSLHDALAASPIGCAEGDMAFVQRLSNGNLHLSAHGPERHKVEKCFESVEQVEDWINSDAGYALYVSPGGKVWTPSEWPLEHHTCGYVRY